MSSQNIYILGIESSCDDTAASVIHNGRILSNIVANQKIHEAYGGVVPELASRAHQSNIVPVILQNKNILTMLFVVNVKMPFPVPRNPF